MTLTKLVVRNITRRRGRFVFTLLGITIGIASFVTFLSMGGNLKKEIYRETAALGANLVVIPKGSCGYEQLSILTGDQMPTNITAEEVAKIRAIKGLTVVPFLAQKTRHQQQAGGGQRHRAGGNMAFKGWQIGAGSIFHALRMKPAPWSAPLRPASSNSSRGRWLPSAVSSCRSSGSSRKPAAGTTSPSSSPCRWRSASSNPLTMSPTWRSRSTTWPLTESYIEKIREATGLGVVSDKQMLKSVLGIVGTVNITLQLIAAVAVLAAAFGIINTMMAATYERKREIGILQALGARQRTIFTLFMLESGFYGIIGGVTGVMVRLC